MKFDKSRVYTALNADEVKIGSKGYFADNLHDLRNKAENGGYALVTISRISSDEHHYRFLASGEPAYSLFYLVEEPEIKEVTAEEWDNRPRIMKVWHDDYSKAQEYKVLAVRSMSCWNYPVVTIPDGSICGMEE